MNENRESATEIKVGLFVLVGLAVVGTMVLYFGGVGDAFRKSYRITVELPDASGLLKDSSVLLAGARIGKVATAPAILLRPELLPVVKRNFARLCGWIREHPLLDAVGWDEAIRRFGGQRARIDREEALQVAARIARERRVAWGDGLSAAETLLLLGEATLGGPGPYPRRDVRGPLRTPPRWAGGRLPAEALREAARAVLATRPGACLPDAVTTSTGVVGIGRASCRERV